MAPRGLWGSSEKRRASTLFNWDVPASNGGSAITGYILDSARLSGGWRRIGDGFPNVDVGLRGREGRLRALPGGGHQRRRGSPVQHHEGVLIGPRRLPLPGSSWTVGIEAWSRTITQRPSSMAPTAVQCPSDSKTCPSGSPPRHQTSA